jgi:hypothetical protein
MARLPMPRRLTSLMLMFAALAPAAALVPSAAVAQSTPSIVFVFDGGGARISGERVRRAVATGLQQSVVRITDEAAGNAHATLTLAFEAPDRWLLDIVRGESHVVRHVRLRTPTVGSLARVAIALVHDTETAPVRPRPATLRRDDDWIATIGDEIIDPFGALPPPIHRTRPVLDELVDPFTGGATTIASSRRRDGVIDPWAH